MRPNVADKTPKRRSESSNSLKKSNISKKWTERFASRKNDTKNTSNTY